MKLRAISVFLGVPLLFIITLVADAHGTGTPQLLNAPAGPYLLSVWTDPDPLRTALEQLIADNPPTIDQESTTSDALHHALRVWTGRMADQFNDDQQWAQPNATQRGTGAAIWPLD